MVLRSTRNRAARSSIEKYSCDDCCWGGDDSCSVTLCPDMPGDSYVFVWVSLCKVSLWSSYSADLRFLPCGMRWATTPEIHSFVLKPAGRNCLLVCT